MIRIGELFAGIGGLGLGLERAMPAAKVLWQVEQDPYALSVLARHWPEARRFTDVRTVKKAQLSEVDILAAGFPCQGASLAGSRRGLADDRTALWWQVVRIAGMLRPKFILLENVSGLLTVSGGRDFGTVLGSLAGIGYDAEWEVISAQSVGAPHRRDRLFIVATVSDPDHMRQHARPFNAEARRAPQPSLCSYWQTAQPDVAGMADGLSSRLDRYRCLGNAVVPQCAEWIGRRIGAKLCLDT